MKIIKGEYSKYSQGFPGEYYWKIYSNRDLDLDLLFSFLTLLSNTSYEYWHLQGRPNPRKNLTFEDYQNILFEKKEIWSSDSDFIHNVAVLSASNLVGISSTFTNDEEEIENRLRYYPEFTKEQFENYKYYMKLEEFLKILQEFLYHALQKTSYIILYKNAEGKVHCEEYFPTQEELKEWNVFLKKEDWEKS
jgi:hypothetical protein